MLPEERALRFSAERRQLRPRFDSVLNRTVQKDA